MLETFGLDPVQEAIYLTLLDRMSATRAQVRRWHATIPPAQVDDALRVLQDRGLVDRKPRARFVAAPPNVALLGWLRQHASALEDAQLAIGALTSRYHAVPRRLDPFDLIEVARGNRARDLVEGARRNVRHQIRGFEHPPYRSAIRGMDPTEREHLARGIRYRLIYDRAAIDARENLDDLRDAIAAGEESRVVGELPSRLILVDDQLAFLPLQHGLPIAESLLIVRPSALLTALSAFFEVVWEKALPLSVGLVPEAGQAGAPFDDSLTVVADLLAAGLTDKAIARQLSISVRTVERHVRRVIAALGAKTRYQAGFLAASRAKPSAEGTPSKGSRGGAEEPLSF